MQDLFSLQHKVCIVTGANGLIGEYHCKALKEAGASVIALDLGEQKINSKYINEYFQCNVTEKSDLVAIKDDILNKYSKIDVLVNNAAINDMFESPQLAAQQSMFENYPLEMWNKSLQVNITGVFLSSQVFGTVMAQIGSGSIINIASTYGIVAPDQSIYVNPDGKQIFYKSAAYPTTKGAVISFTKFLAAYWGKKGVRVNALSPGGVQNGQDDWFVHNYCRKTSLNRMALQSDYMGAIIFLASDSSSYMTGANLVIDGGWTAM